MENKQQICNLLLPALQDGHRKLSQKRWVYHKQPYAQH